MTVIKPYIIIGQSNCRFCQQSKILLDDHGISFRYLDLDDMNWLKAIIKRSDLTTVPIIFNDRQEIIGGYNELDKYLESIS